MLALLAFVTAPAPPALRTPSSTEGEAFFPDFTDPNVATTLEVIEFDEETGAARAVQGDLRGRPLDDPVAPRLPRRRQGPPGQDRRRASSASTRTTSAPTTSPTTRPAAWSTRSTRRPRRSRAGASGSPSRTRTSAVLADFIVGKQPEGRDGFRFVRIPGQKRVYVARIDVDLSTTLRGLDRDGPAPGRAGRDRQRRAQGLLDRRAHRARSTSATWSTLTAGDDEAWKTDRMPAEPGGRLRPRSNGLLGAIDDLNIVGVRPKPAGLSASLRPSERVLGSTQADLSRCRPGATTSPTTGSWSPTRARCRWRPGAGYSTRCASARWSTAPATP